MTSPSGTARNHTLATIVLAFSGLCGSFMFTILVPLQTMLPELLYASREDTAWVITATLLSAAVLTPIAGRLGDMYGKRRMVLILLLLMIVGSFISALSAHVFGVIVGRVFQGAMVGIVPLGISILRDLLPPVRVGGAIAFISATLGMGGALGMPISAVITELMDWRFLFWLSAGLGVMLFALTLWFVPESDVRSGGRFDLIGALLLAAALLCIFLVISKGNQWGWTTPLVSILTASGIALLLVWIWFQLRHSEPLLDLRVAVRPAVLLTNIAAIGTGFSYFVSNVLYPQVLIAPASTGYGLELSVLAGSLCIMPAGLAMMALSPLASRIGRLAGARTLLIIGAAMMTAGYVFNLFLISATWHIVIANALIGAGLGFAYAAMAMLILQSVPQHETGASNGLNTLFRSFGTSLAGAVIGALLAASTIGAGITEFPASDAIVFSLVLGACAAGAASIVALFIPTRRAGGVVG